MAREYEDEHTKSEILEEYLNTASYGTNDGKTAIGVQAASQVFFDKDVSDLNVGEAALLAGLPQAPTDYNPFLNPDGAERRRNQVLDAMSDQGYITFAKAQQNKRKGLGLERGYRYESRTQQYFFDFVQQELIDRVRRADRARRRAQGLYDARSEAAGGRRAGDRGAPGLRRRPGAGLDRRRHRRDHRDGVLGVLRGQPVQPRRPGPPPAGLLVQALRADHRGRPGHRPGLDLLLGPLVDHALPERRLRRAVDRLRRRQRLDEPALGDRELDQHRLRAAGARRRGREHGRDGEADGRHQPALGLRRRTCSGPAT